MTLLARKLGLRECKRKKLHKHRLKHAQAHPIAIHRQCEAASREINNEVNAPPLRTTESFIPKRGCCAEDCRD